MRQTHVTPARPILKVLKAFESFTGATLRFNGHNGKRNQNSEEFARGHWDYQFTLYALSSTNIYGSFFTLQPIYLCCGAAFLSGIHFNNNQIPRRLFEALIEEILRDRGRSLALYTNRSDRSATDMSEFLKHGWRHCGDWFNRKYMGSNIAQGGSPLYLLMKDTTQPGALTVESVIKELEATKKEAAASSVLRDSLGRFTRKGA